MGVGMVETWIVGLVGREAVSSAGTAFRAGLVRVVGMASSARIVSDW